MADESTIVVGTDTYITAAAADTYIDQFYPSTDVRHVAWSALSVADKDVLLRRAARTIDALRLAGIKATSTQTMAFPRALPTDVSQYNNATLDLTQLEGYYVQAAAPDAVKYAQVEIALQLAVGEPKRVELQRQGVRSMSIGKLSESYAGKHNQIVSHEARELLAPFVVGGVKII